MVGRGRRPATANLADGNTRTGVISLGLGRSEDAGYVASPRATIGIWTAELDRVQEELNEKRLSIGLWGPAGLGCRGRRKRLGAGDNDHRSVRQQLPVHGADGRPTDTVLVGTT
jgi:hypothetical protein